MTDSSYECLFSKLSNIRFEKIVRERINDGVRRISFEELVKKVGLEMSDLD